MTSVQVQPTDKARELSLVTGESELLKATRSHGCFFRDEDNIVVTSLRVQFLWRKKFCGIKLGTVEEAFNLDDLQANIIDWKSTAKISGCKRSIKLANSQAQEAYNHLQAMLQQRAELKAARKAHK